MEPTPAAAMKAHLDDRYSHHQTISIRQTNGEITEEREAAIHESSVQFTLNELWEGPYPAGWSMCTLHVDEQNGQATGATLWHTGPDDSDLYQVTLDHVGRFVITPEQEYAGAGF